MLPKINRDLKYKTITLPFSNKTVGLRPFTFGEEKNYLISIGNKKDERIFYEKTKSLIYTCLAEDDKHVLDSASKFDFKYLCKELRRISKGSTIELREKCSNEKCKFSFDLVQLDLNVDYKIKIRETNEIKVSDKLVIYIEDLPLAKEQEIASRYTNSTTNLDEVNKFEIFYDFLVASIVKVVYDGEVYEEFTEVEAADLLDNLAIDENVDIVDAYSKSMNSFEIFKKIKCPMCSEETTINIDSLGFFLI